MSFLQAFLLPLLAGYIFLNVCYYFRYSFNQSSGYHSIFRAALWGSFFFLVAKLTAPILFAAIHNCFPSLSEFWIANRPEYTPATGILAVVIGYAAAQLWNRCLYGQKKAEAGLFNEDPIQSHIYKSVKENKPVIITLRSRKVYVGLVVEIDSNPLKGRSIGLIPIHSGYRDRYRLKVRMTNGYEDLAYILTSPPDYKFTKNDCNKLNHSLDELNSMRESAMDYLVTIDFAAIEMVGPWNNVTPVDLEIDRTLYSTSFKVDLDLDRFQPVSQDNPDKRQNG